MVCTILPATIIYVSQVLLLTYCVPDLKLGSGDINMNQKIDSKPFFIYQIARVMIKKCLLMQ